MSRVTRRLNEPPHGFLVAIDGPRRGHWWCVDRPLLLGTVARAEIVVDGRDVRSEHLRLEPTADGLRLTDLHPNGAASLNGRPIAPDSRPTLIDNDTLTVGTTTLRFKHVQYPARAQRPSKPSPKPTSTRVLADNDGLEPTALIFER